MYKFSKYTVAIENDADELILYNSLKGSKSLCKISSDKRLGFEKTFKNADVSFNNPILSILQEKGHVVDEIEEEDMKLKSIYLDTIDSRTLNITILPTGKCNFACIYCYEDFEHGKMKPKIMDNIISFVEKNIRHYDALHVSWFGGEPLLAKDIIEEMSKRFLSICKQYKKMYYASITTNGYYLNLETFQMLYKYRVFHYQITIDGMQESHNKQRPLVNGGETFDTIFKNLVDIKENISSKLFHILLRTNISKSIADNIVDYFQYLDEKIGNDSRFEILLRPVMDWGGERIANQTSNLFDLEEFQMYCDILSKCNCKVAMTKQFLEPGSQVCYAGYKNQYTFNSVGEIFKCTCNLDNESCSKIGECKENVIINDYLTSLWIAEMKPRSKKCETCFYAPVCLYDYCPNNRIKNPNSDVVCPIDKYCFETIIKRIDQKEEIAYLF